LVRGIFVRGEFIRSGSIASHRKRLWWRGRRNIIFWGRLHHRNIRELGSPLNKLFPFTVTRAS
jgi:hypothetical protein